MCIGYLKEAESAPKLVTVPKVLSYIIYDQVADRYFSRG